VGRPARTAIDAAVATFYSPGIDLTTLRDLSAEMLGLMRPLRPANQRRAPP
jgi:hypothetical protein